MDSSSTGEVDLAGRTGGSSDGNGSDGPPPSGGPRLSFLLSVRLSTPLRLRGTTAWTRGPRLGRTSIWTPNYKLFNGSGRRKDFGYVLRKNIDLTLFRTVHSETGPTVGDGVPSCPVRTGSLQTPRLITFHPFNLLKDYLLSHKQCQRRPFRRGL